MLLLLVNLLHSYFGSILTILQGIRVLFDAVKQFSLLFLYFLIVTNKKHVFYSPCFFF